MAAKNDNLYSILNLKQDCSAKDIKRSFIELSKKYHPDMSKEKSGHAEFLKVNEAYSVLSKPASRRMYDEHLHSNKIRPYYHYYDNIYTTRNDPSFRANQEKGTGFGNEPYYSIKGLKKVSNSVILTVCFVIASIGLGVEFFALQKSITFDQEKLRHDSARNQLLWEVARKRAEASGNDQQIQKLKDNALQGSSIREINEMYSRRLLDINTNEKDVNGK